MPCTRPLSTYRDTEQKEEEVEEAQLSFIMFVFLRLATPAKFSVCSVEREKRSTGPATAKVHSIFG